MDRNYPEVVPQKAELFIVFLHLVKSQEHHTSAFLILSASYSCSILLNSLLEGANEEKKGGEDTDIIIPGAVVGCCTNWYSANKISTLMHNQV